MLLPSTLTEGGPFWPGESGGRGGAVFPLRICPFPPWWLGAPPVSRGVGPLPPRPRGSRANRSTLRRSFFTPRVQEGLTRLYMYKRMSLYMYSSSCAGFPNRSHRPSSSDGALAFRVLSCPMATRGPKARQRRGGCVSTGSKRERRSLSSWPWS